jgi:DNA-binding transcriptional MerR regulator
VYTVKQLSELAHVSVRTLHYYDEIGLLNPSKTGANGYRYYDDAALFRLQQVLFYREIGLELLQIKAILDSDDFDLAAALRSHRQVLHERVTRLQSLICTVDATLEHVEGESEMSKKKLFEGFSEEEQKQYEREARLQYGPDNVNESVKRWNSYTKTQQEAIQREGGQVYLDLVDAIKTDKAPDSADVRAILTRWHNHIHYFYEPTLEILRGLGETYNTDARFIAFFDRFHPDLAPYLQTSIAHYVDDLETAEIEHMLAVDDERHTASR